MDSLVKEVFRVAEIYQAGCLAGYLEELDEGVWRFRYLLDYKGAPVSLTMQVKGEVYLYNEFPSVFDGLLPEGPQLEALLRKHKIDRKDTFRQLTTIGDDFVGSLSVKSINLTAASHVTEH
tara:strand:+ start:1067 stop:1429 length:363 start_codon:yes stop_codon:yes gene_type:complete